VLETVIKGADQGAVSDRAGDRAMPIESSIFAVTGKRIRHLPIGNELA
jgi:hypothetical protein